MGAFLFARKEKNMPPPKDNKPRAAPKRRPSRRAAFKNRSPRGLHIREVIL
jgi:hypothetical protein